VKRGRWIEKWRAAPDLRTALVLGGSVALAKLMYLPGHAALQAWRNLNNPILYADRFAFPQLLPNDRIMSHLRDLYPYLSIVYLAPALLLKYLAVPPHYVTFLEVAVTDASMVVAIYWLARAMGLARDLSALSGLFALVSKVLSWDLGGYDYLGHDFAYSGSMFVPFAVAVLPCVIQGHYRLALVLAAVAGLVFAPAGALMSAVVAIVLLVERRSGSWRRVVPWFGLPLLALIGAALVQLAVSRRIVEPFTAAEDLAVVMGNGHFVPYWLRGYVASTYLGFAMWCGLAALAARQWRALTARQRLPLLVMAGLIMIGFAGGFLAVAMGWTFVLRLGPFRYSLLLGIVAIPMVIAYLADLLRTGDGPTRALTALLLALLAIDRSTAWLLPVILPCLALLAMRAWLPAPPRPLASAAVAAIFVVSFDLVWQGGISARASGLVDHGGRIAEVLAEAGRRLREGRWELLVLLAVILPMLFRPAPPRGAVIAHPRLVPAWCVLLMACFLARTADVAFWAATGPPSKLADVALWAKSSTPLAAKFVFLEVDEGGNNASWQTLSQRAGAEMLYTHQKAYLADRELLRVDRLVSAHYGLDSAQHDASLGVAGAPELFPRYRAFTEPDFLRVGRLSGSNFVVLRGPRTLSFPVAFSSEPFTAYRIPAVFDGLTVTPLAIADGAVTVAWQPASGAPADRQLFVEWREARTGQPVDRQCCATIGRAAGEHVFRLPGHLSGAYLPLIGIVGADGQRVPLAGDASGERLAFWNHVVSQ